MQRITSGLLIAGLVASMGAQAAIGGPESDNGQASIEVLPTLQLNNLRDLNFGTLIAPSSNTGFTVSVAPRLGLNGGSGKASFVNDFVANVLGLKNDRTGVTTLGGAHGADFELSAMQPANGANQAILITADAYGSQCTNGTTLVIEEEDVELWVGASLWDTVESLDSLPTNVRVGGSMEIDEGVRGYIECSFTVRARYL